MPRMRATTILAVRHKGKGAIGGDGQVTLGNVVMKSDAHKIRKLYEGKVLVGFAGASADAFALLERFEAKLRDHQGSVPRAATELAKEWRTDRMLRRLEAMMIALDREHLLLVSGPGDREEVAGDRRGHLHLHEPEHRRGGSAGVKRGYGCRRSSPSRLSWAG